MITSGMVQKLNTQMNHEFYTSNMYLQLSQWCSENSLNGTALFLRHQAQNTVTQMMRMFEYIKQRGAMPVINETCTHCDGFATLEELFEHTVKDYQHRINALTTLTTEAQKTNDPSIVNFLNTLKKEELEDGTLLQIILDEVRSARKAGINMQQTDKHLVDVIDLYH
ncbi:non-heme ferritin-like protein [Atlantibacter sp.]|uniref:non-heme ferritin-like protein n=1 Tax=Atlantibacter sp. TaxID=1903473 RepID=UPI0013EF62A4|nr:non-heme ferritin-like protein [Atlantibacter sp.]